MLAAEDAPGDQYPVSGGAFLPHGFCEDCLKERYPEMAGTLLTEKT
ncbi:MAG: hypothetical protein JRJ72_06665 [Deltaproteobacteria bacterium]|nr:hypothetical protein [Deltaproteobacteria bacterium]